MTRKRSDLPSLATVMKALTDEDFLDAWKETNGAAGVGSLLSAKRVAKLLKENHSHSKFLYEVTTKCAKYAAEFADAMDKADDCGARPLDNAAAEHAFEKLLGDTIDQILTVASIYTVVGLTVGTVRIANMQRRKEAEAAAAVEKTEAINGPTQ